MEAVTAMETVEQLREAATSINMKFSGNTGEGTLRKNIMEALATDQTSEPELNSEEESKTQLSFLDVDPEEVIQKAIIPDRKKAPTIDDLLEMDPNEIEDPQLVRQVVRARGLRLHRVRITNLDPNDAQLSGAIITAMNKYTGKVSRFIPYGDENESGTHVEQILLNHLKQQKFALRKEIKGGAFGVKKYTTKMINKFSIEELPLLTKEELKNLADQQRASHAIDN